MKEAGGSGSWSFAFGGWARDSMTMAAQSRLEFVGWSPLGM